MAENLTCQCSSPSPCPSSFPQWLMQEKGGQWGQCPECQGPFFPPVFAQVLLPSCRSLCLSLPFQQSSDIGGQLSLGAGTACLVSGKSLDGPTSAVLRRHSGDESLVRVKYPVLQTTHTCERQPRAQITCVAKQCVGANTLKKELQEIKMRNKMRNKIAEVQRQLSFLPGCFGWTAQLWPRAWSCSLDAQGRV